MKMPILSVRDDKGNIIPIPAIQGPKGDNGADGYTPVRGTDYWTDEDKVEIESYVDKQFVDVNTALDSILAIQNELIGGDGV